MSWGSEWQVSLSYKSFPSTWTTVQVQMEGMLSQSSQEEKKWAHLEPVVNMNEADWRPLMKERRMIKMRKKGQGVLRIRPMYIPQSSPRCLVFAFPNTRYLWITQTGQMSAVCNASFLVVLAPLFGLFSHLTAVESLCYFWQFPERSQMTEGEFRSFWDKSSQWMFLDSVLLPF